MNFFNLSERIDLAAQRTWKNIEGAQRYVRDNPEKAALIVGAVFVLAFVYPAPVILTLCVSALVLIGINFFSDASISEGFSSAWNTIKNF